MRNPPPPRYKIVERAGRLVTIDTWAAKGAPPSATAPRAEPSRGMRPDLASAPPALPERAVAAVLRVRDDRGRRLLTTGPGWDRKGPRTIALSPAGERRLGWVLLAAAALAAGLAVVAIVQLEWLLPLAVVGAVLFGSASKSGGPLLTRFLDTLGESTPA